MHRRFSTYVSALALLVAIVTLLTTPHASAGEGTFGWIYTLDLQPKGEWEFEQRLQLNQNQAAGTYQLWGSRTELAYGLTNDIQIAGYINASRVVAKGNYTTCAMAESDSCPYTAGYLVNNGATNSSPYSKTRYDGASLELLWRITNPVTSPIGIGLYIEPTLGPVKNELEGRLLLQSNFLDDKLVLAGNIVAATENQKWMTGEPYLETMLDFLFGVSYRFAPKWTGGIEARQHNDFLGATYNKQTQTAWFLGPNLHYAEKNWWATAAYRRQLGGSCMNGGQVECSNGYVWDSHTTNEFIVKFGVPF